MGHKFVCVEATERPSWRPTSSPSRKELNREKARWSSAIEQWRANCRLRRWHSVAPHSRGDSPAAERSMAGASTANSGHRSRERAGRSGNLGRDPWLQDPDYTAPVDQCSCDCSYMLTFVARSDVSASKRPPPAPRCLTRAAVRPQLYPRPCDRPPLIDSARRARLVTHVGAVA